MAAEGFRKLFWGFLFIMIDFRVQGLDILPDLIGFIFFALGINALVAESDFFGKARGLIIPAAILSVFHLYERPVEGEGIQFGPLGPFGVLIGLLYIVLTLLVVYNLFMGIPNSAQNSASRLKPPGAGINFSC